MHIDIDRKHKHSASTMLLSEKQKHAIFYNNCLIPKYTGNWTHIQKWPVTTSIIHVTLVMHVQKVAEKEDLPNSTSGQIALVFEDDSQGTDTAH